MPFNHSLLILSIIFSSKCLLCCIFIISPWNWPDNNHNRNCISALAGVGSSFFSASEHSRILMCSANTRYRVGIQHTGVSSVPEFVPPTKRESNNSAAAYIEFRLDVCCPTVNMHNTYFEFQTTGRELNTAFFCLLKKLPFTIHIPMK